MLAAGDSLDAILVVGVWRDSSLASECFLVELVWLISTGTVFEFRPQFKAMIARANSTKPRKMCFLFTI